MVGQKKNREYKCHYCPASASNPSPRDSGIHACPLHRKELSEARLKWFNIIHPPKKAAITVDKTLEE
jgi:hypothetical protein